jgi:hypothetical protein
MVSLHDKIKQLVSVDMQKSKLFNEMCGDFTLHGVGAPVWQTNIE